MAKEFLLLGLSFLTGLFGASAPAAAQARDPNMAVFHVTVNMVQLDVAVTDKKGHYITGLSPYDFSVYEDGIRQKVAIFGEENAAPRDVAQFGPASAKLTPIASLSAKIAGRLSNPEPTSMAISSVFVLFDTSDYMYRGFVFAQDAIAEFVRSLDPSDRVAFYSYSRNFSRACPLTSNRSEVMRAVRTTVAGDDAALYDALLLTLEDAGKFSGKRVVVVFSNGPDDASMVSPEDVRELAQSEGIPIYMISTREAELDPLSTAVFKRVSATTGGKAYFARRWEDQLKAFASIRSDLAHLYTLSYYPQANSNHGWRKITVKLAGALSKKYHLRTRSGYRPEVARLSTAASPTP